MYFALKLAVAKRATRLNVKRTVRLERIHRAQRVTFRKNPDEIRGEKVRRFVSTQSRDVLLRRRLRDGVERERRDAAAEGDLIVRRAKRGESRHSCALRERRMQKVQSRDVRHAEQSREIISNSLNRALRRRQQLLRLDVIQPQFRQRIISLRHIMRRPERFHHPPLTQAHHQLHRLAFGAIARRFHRRRVVVAVARRRPRALASHRRHQPRVHRLERVSQSSIAHSLDLRVERSRLEPLRRHLLVVHRASTPRSFDTIAPRRLFHHRAPPPAPRRRARVERHRAHRLPSRASRRVVARARECGDASSNLCG